MNYSQYITNFRFQGAGICTYLEYIGKKKPKGNNWTPPNEKNHGLSSGLMTKGAIKRCRNYLDLWTNAIFSVQQLRKNPSRSYRRFITFVTLTLPSKQQDTDRVIKNCILYPFIDSIQRLYDVKNYVWKAEKQKNGNVHFHLVIDKYIRHELIRHQWNYHLEKKQYVTKYAEKRMIDHKIEIDFLNKFQPNANVNNTHGNITALAMAYQKSGKLSTSACDTVNRFSSYLKKIKRPTTFAQVKARIMADFRSGFNSPNSTDIHAPEKIKNLTAYVVKIFSKEQRQIKRCENAHIVGEISKTNAKTSENIEDIRIDGRCWGRSDGLNVLYNFTTTECDDTKSFLTKIKELKLAKIIEGDFYKFTAFNLYELLSKYSKKLFCAVKNHFETLYYLLYPDNQIQLALT
jgi:hypothetical protein